jgi:hypothetical protein
MGVTTIFVVLGFLPPSNYGRLISEMVIVLVFMGLLTSPASSRLYMMFNSTESKTITLKTTFKFPGIILAVFFMNAMIWVEESFGAVPFLEQCLPCFSFGLASLACVLWMLDQAAAT